MLAAAPAVPLVGIPALVTLAFVTFVAALLAWGFVKLFDYTLGLVLDEVSDLVDGLPLVGGFAADKLRRVKNYMRGRIADAALALDATAARFWQGAQQLVELTADALYEFGGDVYDAYRALVEVTIPGTIAAGTAPIDRRLDRLNKREDARARAEAQARARGLDAVQRDLVLEKLAREKGIDAVITRVTARIRAGEAALAGEIARVWEYARGRLSRRLSRVEKLVLGGAITAAAVVALDRRFPFWKCSNVRNFNRFLCRLPTGLLAALLAVGVPVLVLSDICRIAGLIRRGADAAEPVLRGLVVVADAALECAASGPAAPLPLEAQAVPDSDLALAL